MHCKCKLLLSTLLQLIRPTMEYLQASSRDVTQLYFFKINLKKKFQNGRKPEKGHEFDDMVQNRLKINKTEIRVMIKKCISKAETFHCVLP